MWSFFTVRYSLVVSHKFRDTEALYKDQVKIMHPFTGGEDPRLKLVARKSPKNYHNLALFKCVCQLM